VKRSTNNEECPPGVYTASGLQNLNRGTLLQL
jgi:hypothetical protein